jgi:hypothetical protein
MYQDTLTRNYTAYPATLRTYGLPKANTSGITEADNIVLKFVDTLARYLLADVRELNISNQWSLSYPKNASSDLEEYLGYTWLALAAKEQIRLVRDPFFAEYASRFGGRKPYVNPVANRYWTWGSTFNQTVEESLHIKSTFMQWWNEEILSGDDKTCSESLVVYVGANALGVQGEPDYRFMETGSLPYVKGILGGLFVAPMSGVTDIVMPIGEVAYFSNVTMHEEVLPITVNIMASRHCDLMLLDLVHDLEATGVLSTVATGNSIRGGPIFT